MFRSARGSSFTYVFLSHLLPSYFTSRRFLLSFYQATTVYRLHHWLASSNCILDQDKAVAGFWEIWRATSHRIVFYKLISGQWERDNQLWNWNLVGAKVLRVKHTFVMFSVSRVSYLRGPRSKLLQNNYFHLKNTLKVYEKSPPSPSIRGASIFVNGWIEQTTPTNTLSLSLLEHQ